ncbi:MAG: metallophosphoesterase [Myxococcota bacterium]
MSRVWNLAHFSDIHLTSSPLRARGPVLNKRLAGALNYYVGGRRQHFAGARQRIARLLEDVEASGVDHVLCTGDITQMSFREEFEGVAALYGERREAPERYSIIPGNHDRYTPEAVAEDVFGQLFGRIASPEGRYPHLKRLADGEVALVLLDASRATGPTDSSGRLGSAQLEALESLLTAPEQRDRYVALALHYGLFRYDGAPDRPHHALRDLPALLSLLERPDIRVDLVLHGHMHRPYALQVGRSQVICVGSATDLHVLGGWHRYAVDLERRTLSLTRRVWSPEAGGYVASDRPIPGWPPAGSRAPG